MYSAGGAVTQNGDEEKSTQEYCYIYEKMQCVEYNYELFVKHKGILVKATDEVLNNLVDQSRFLVKFELPRMNSNVPQTVLNGSSSSTEAASSTSINKSLLVDRDNLIKIVMTPLN